MPRRLRLVPYTHRCTCGYRTTHACTRLPHYILHRLFIHIYGCLHLRFDVLCRRFGLPACGSAHTACVTVTGSHVATGSPLVTRFTVPYTTAARCVYRFIGYAVLLRFYVTRLPAHVLYRFTVGLQFVVYYHAVPDHYVWLHTRSYRFGYLLRTHTFGYVPLYAYLRFPLRLLHCVVTRTCGYICVRFPFTCVCGYAVPLVRAFTVTLRLVRWIRSALYGSHVTHVCVLRSACLVGFAYTAGCPHTRFANIPYSCAGLLVHRFTAPWFTTLRTVYARTVARHAHAFAAFAVARFGYVTITHWTLRLRLRCTPGLPAPRSGCGSGCVYVHYRCHVCRLV